MTWERKSSLIELILRQSFSRVSIFELSQFEEWFAEPHPRLHVTLSRLHALNPGDRCCVSCGGCHTNISGLGRALRMSQKESYVTACWQFQVNNGPDAVTWSRTCSIIVPFCQTSVMQNQELTRRKGVRGRNNRCSECVMQSGLF